MTRPIVSVLTDFGVRDVSAAICRACIAVNQGSAVHALGLRDGTRLERRRR